MIYTKAEFAQAAEWQLAMVRRQEREAQRKAFIEEARQYDPPRRRSSQEAIEDAIFGEFAP